MPNISLRLSQQEHELLREWAHGARRSMQREIVFRLFDGAKVADVVQPVVHDVPVRPHMKRDMPAVQCPTRIVSGMCPDCGKYL